MKSLTGKFKKRLGLLVDQKEVDIRSWLASLLPSDPEWGKKIEPQRPQNNLLLIRSECLAKRRRREVRSRCVLIEAKKY